MCKGATTSKIKHAIKLKTSPARLAQLLHPFMSILFQLAANDGALSRTGRYAVIGRLAASYNKMLMRAATVVQVLQDLF